MKRRYGVYTPPALPKVDGRSDGSNQNERNHGSEPPSADSNFTGMQHQGALETQPENNTTDMSCDLQHASGKMQSRPKIQELIKLYENRHSKQKNISFAKSISSVQQNYQDYNSNLNTLTKTIGCDTHVVSLKIDGSDIQDVNVAKENIQKRIGLNDTGTGEVEPLSDNQNICQTASENLDISLQINQRSGFKGDQLKFGHDKFNHDTASRKLSPQNLQLAIPFVPPMKQSERTMKGLKLLSLPSIEEHDIDTNDDYSLQQEKSPPISPSRAASCHNISTDTTNGTEKPTVITGDYNAAKHCSVDDCENQAKIRDANSIDNEILVLCDENDCSILGAKIVSVASLNDISITEETGSITSNICQACICRLSHQNIFVKGDIKYSSTAIESKSIKVSNTGLLGNQNDGYLYNKLNVANKNTKGGLLYASSNSKVVCQVRLENDGLGQDRDFLTPICKEENTSSLSRHFLNSQQKLEHSRTNSTNPKNVLKQSEAVNKITSVLRAKRAEMEVEMGNYETKNSFQYLVAMEGSSGQLIYCVNNNPNIWDSKAKRSAKNRSIFRDKLCSTSNETISDPGSENSGQHDYSLDSLEFGDIVDLDSDVKVGNSCEFCLDIDNGNSPVVVKKSNFYIDTSDGLVAEVGDEYSIETPKDRTCTCKQIANFNNTKENNVHSQRSEQRKATAQDMENCSTTRDDSEMDDIETISGKQVKHTVNIELNVDAVMCPVHHSGSLDSLEEKSDSTGTGLDEKDLDENANCSCRSVTDKEFEIKSRRAKHIYFFPHKKHEDDALPKSVSSPNLRNNRIRIPRIKFTDSDKADLIEQEQDVYMSETSSTSSLYRCPGSENVHLLSHHFSPSLKRKLSSHKQENDLEQLKQMANRLSLTTRRPSYLMWKERLNNEPLSKLAQHQEIGGSKNEEKEDEGENEQARIEAVDYAISWLRRELTEMRAQDQVLARTLIKLRGDLKEIKLQRSCAQHQEILEDAMDLEEEREILGELSCDYIPDPFSPTLKQAGLTKLNIETRRFSVF